MLSSTHTMPPSGNHRGNQRDHSFDQNELLTVKEVATLLRVPVSWVYDRTRKRSIDRLPGIRLGKYWRFRQGEVLAWIESQSPKGNARMKLDAHGKLGSDIGKGRRTNHSKERKRMVRCRYQDGYLFIRGKKRKMWVARWRESVIQPDGTVGRILRSETLGLVSEISSRREARVLLQDRLATLNSGQRRAEATMSFGDFVTQQIEPVVLPTLKPATQEVYSYLLQKHLLPRFRDCRLVDITRAEVQQFLIGKLKAGYAWETTHHLRSLMSKIVGTAVDWNYLSVNPVRGAKMPERSLKRPHRFLSLEEVRRLLENSDEPVRTIVLLAVMTGLRIGEILALRWGRINLAAGTLRVEETCYKGTFGTPKTRASRRELPLAPAVVQALQAHHIRSRNSADDALVFAARQGTPLDAKNLRRRQLHSASQRAGLGLIDWHSLRHTHGTLLHEQGTPLRVAQAQLGHSHMTTTLQIYTHASGSAQRQAVVHLESLLFPSVPKFAAARKRPNEQVVVNAGR